MPVREILTYIAWLAGSVTFILALKFLASPRTARTGNLLGAAGVPPFLAFCAIALVTGVVLVMPIGGADMPVVISLLNAYTGIAVAATGFVLGNYALLIAGTLVGASGTILTQLMTRAMNRSLMNVLFAGFGTGGGPAAAGAEGGEQLRGN